MKTLRLTLFAAIAVCSGCITHDADKSLAPPVSEVSSIIFDGNEFPVTRARIWAKIPDPYWCDRYNQGNGKSILWTVELATKQPANTEDLMPPILELDLMPSGLRNWHELVGHVEKWSTPNTSHASIFVYDHQSISKGEFKILERDGAKFRVVGNGIDLEGNQLEFSVVAEFEGVWVDGSGNDSQESIDARLEQYLDIGNFQNSRFKLAEEEYTSGVKMGHAFFKPRLETANFQQ